jgi:hypothetical protein
VASVIARLPLSEYMIREPSLVQPRTPRTDSLRQPVGAGPVNVHDPGTVDAAEGLQWPLAVLDRLPHGVRDETGRTLRSSGRGRLGTGSGGRRRGRPDRGGHIGGTRAGRLTGPDPITSAPASSATSTAAAARRTINGRPEERRERKTGRLTAVTVVTRPRSAARAPMVSHRSGVETSSRVANRRRRSSIAVSQ